MFRLAANGERLGGRHFKGCRPCLLRPDSLLSPHPKTGWVALKLGPY
jgi:hypothetical protein